MKNCNLECRFLWGLLSITGVAYVGSAGLAGVLFYYFKPSGAGDCSFNVTIICLTLFLGCIVTAVSMSPFVSLCYCSSPVFAQATYILSIVMFTSCKAWCLGGRCLREWPSTPCLLLCISKLRSMKQEPGGCFWKSYRMQACEA